MEELSRDIDIGFRLIDHCVEERDPSIVCWVVMGGSQTHTGP